MRLLVVGIKWPPETFIHRKLEGLAERGVEVVVAATSSGREGTHGNGIRFLQLPEWNRSWSGRVSDMVLTVLRASMRSPRNVRAFASAVNGRGSSVRRRLRSYHRFLPFVGVRADVVHFEWNSVALEFLPSLTFWVAPWWSVVAVHKSRWRRTTRTARLWPRGYVRLSRRRQRCIASPKRFDRRASRT